MLTILLKVTIVWLLLLSAYFLLLSKEKAPHLNRLFLWLALIAGIAIPLIENPFLSVQPTVQAINQTIAPANGIIEGNTSTSSPAKEVQTVDWIALIGYLWLAGAAIQAFLLLRNAGQLYFLKKFSCKIQHPIADFYSNKNTPAAFSFGKLIYLPEAAYNAQDLRLILQHEQQHARHKHWIDNTALELLQIVFWFHPLFYLFKKQIKLVHEYQVDQEIDAADQYDYAQLLLAQNNKAYTDKLIHTFNFSPLKKRIAMMTNTKKASNWKYFFTLPAIALCFGLMSAKPVSDQRVRKGNITTFRGNTIEWQTGKVDTIEVVDPASGAIKTSTFQHSDHIIKVNGHHVTQGIYVDGEMRKSGFKIPLIEEISKNIEQALYKNKSRIPDDIASIFIQDLVIDKDLNIYYYDVVTSGENVNDTSLSGFNKLAIVNKVVDETIKNKKLINPENKKLDKDFYTLRAGVGFKTVQLNINVINPR